MSDISGYYSRSPSSGFWILDYGERFVGLIAIDASQADTASGAGSSKKTLKGTSATATIRHFYVTEEFRASGVQDDLLTHAVRHTFRSDAAVLRITAHESSLIPYIPKCLGKHGFQKVDKAEKVVGLFRWKFCMRILERGNWEKSTTST